MNMQAHLSTPDYRQSCVHGTGSVHQQGWTFSLLLHPPFISSSFHPFVSKGRSGRAFPSYENDGYSWEKEEVRGIENVGK